MDVGVHRRLDDRLVFDVLVIDHGRASLIKRSIISLSLDQGAVEPFFIFQALMGSSLDDASVVNNKNFVAVLDRAEPMGDHDAATPPSADVV